MKIRSSQVDYVIVSLMVVMSAGVSFLGATIFRFLLLVVVLGVIFLRNKPLNLRNFKYIIIFYLVWCLGVFLTFDVNLVQSGQLFTYLSFFTLVIASYYTTVALNDFFSIYIKVIYHLAIISFFFYSLQLINLDLLLTILRSFDEINSIFREEISRPSIVIFTYGTDAGISLRNYGFATEPGEFSVFLVLALMLQVSLNNFKIDRVLTILVIAVLTTFSTAGYLGLIIFILYILINKRLSLNKLWFAIIAIPVVFLIVDLEFVLDKASEAWDRETVRYDQAYQATISPGRIGSLLLDLEDFMKNPLIGYGIHSSTRYINYVGIDQQRTNGVTDYLVKFGLIGFIIMLYNFKRTFKVELFVQNIVSSYLIILAIMVVSFAQVILVTPVFLAIQFYHFQKDKLNSNPDK